MVGAGGALVLLMILAAAACYMYGRKKSQVSELATKRENSYAARPESLECRLQAPYYPNAAAGSNTVRNQGRSTTRHFPADDDIHDDDPNQYFLSTDNSPRSGVANDNAMSLSTFG